MQPYLFCNSELYKQQIFLLHKFYFIESAKTMKNRIIVESNIKNIDILKLSKNKFRVILGPYLDLKSLQKEYNKLDKFNFENIEIIKNV